MIWYTIGAAIVAGAYYGITFEEYQDQYDKFKKEGGRPELQPETWCFIYAVFFGTIWPLSLLFILAAVVIAFVRG